MDTKTKGEQLNIEKTDNIVDKAYELVNLFYEHGFEAYLVGGCVRDLFMSESVPKIHDIDITTIATPEQIIDIANANNINWLQEGENGRNYGTVTILYDNIPMQVTPFRTDKNYDGRHCECEFVQTLKEDLQRRDFTVNAIALDKDGYPIDYFCGIADIALGRIKSIETPEVTYRRDELRVMRAIRFATTLDFYIEDKTYDAIKHVKLNKLSQERIRDELSKILESPNRCKGILLLDDTGLLEQIIPALVALKGVDQDERHHPEKDVFLHTMLVVKSLLPNSSLENVLAGLLHDIGKSSTQLVDGTEIHFYGHEVVSAEIAEKILYRLKFKSEIIKKVGWLIKNHMKIHKFNEMKKSKKVKLVEHEYFNDLVELLRADIMGSSGINGTTPDLNEITVISDFLKEYEKEKRERPVLKERLITGYDIMNLGITPEQGILIGQILEQVNDEVIEGRINSKSEALQYTENLVNYYKCFNEKIKEALNNLVNRGIVEERIREDGIKIYRLVQ